MSHNQYYCASGNFLVFWQSNLIGEIFKIYNYYKGDIHMESIKLKQAPIPAAYPSVAKNNFLSVAFHAMQTLVTNIKSNINTRSLCNLVCVACYAEAYYNLQNPSMFVDIPIAYGYDSSFFKFSVEYSTLDTLGKALSEPLFDASNTLSNLAWGKAHYAVCQTYSMGYKWTAMLFSYVYAQYLLTKLDRDLSYTSKPS